MTNTTLLSNYLTYTLIPALHEKRIYIDNDAYRVHVTDCTRAGEFVHVERMSHPADDWTIIATPGWDGSTTTIPVDVHTKDGVVVLADNAMDIHWTGKLDYDVQIYLHAVRTHIIKYVLPALWPDSSEDDANEANKQKLEDIVSALEGCGMDLAEMELSNDSAKVVRTLRLTLKQYTNELHDAIPYLTGTSA